MRKPNKDKERINCEFFSWLVGKRKGTYYADGRGNQVPLGRFSLGTPNHAEALETLRELDRRQAVQVGKADRSVMEAAVGTLSLADGRKLYEEHIKRPAVTGGTRQGTHKRYRAVLDKFLEFAESVGLKSWSQVTRQVLSRYAAHLEEAEYATNTIYLELTTLKQIVKWMIEEHHLPDSCRITLKLMRDEESNTYCWTLAEFQAIVAHCRRRKNLNWLADIVLTLGLTGMRISELAQLRWSNLKFEPEPVFHLIDESRRGGRAKKTARTLKSKRSRSFPMNKELIPVLQSMARREDGLVFHGPRGGHVKPDTVRNIFIKEVLAPLKHQFPAARGEVGFEHGRLHSFRHFFCSQCANSGVTERILMTWLGHADAKMVRRYYHLDDEESQRQMNRVSIRVVNAGDVAGVVRNKEETNPATTVDND